jgi:dienelactone hydrolase
MLLLLAAAANVLFHHPHAHRYEWATRVGDAEKNETLNREISPYYHVDNIKAPLLIGQGANDPRVPQPESDQMFRAMKAKGHDVQYVLYPGGLWGCAHRCWCLRINRVQCFAVRA